MLNLLEKKGTKETQGQLSINPVRHTELLARPEAKL